MFYMYYFGMERTRQLACTYLYYSKQEAIPIRSLVVGGNMRVGQTISLPLFKPTGPVVFSVAWRHFGNSISTSTLPLGVYAHST